MEKKKREQSNCVESKRQPEFEVLRCLAMMMVVVLHYLGKGGLLGELSGETMPGVQTAAWVLEAFAICAVNLYMLLSGYFLSQSRFKLSRLLQLLLQIWMYSVGVGILAVLLGFVPAQEINTYFLLRLVFPVLEEHYWFVSAYVFIYLLLPLVGNAVRTMEKKPFRLVIGLFLTILCFVKTVMPFQFDGDKLGYDCLWYLCVFLIAAYLRRFGLGILGKKGLGILLYMGSVVLIIGLTFGLRIIYLKTGRFELILKNGFHYNHLFPLLAAIGLFAVFAGFSGERSFGIPGKEAVFAGPYTLGVYLLHENLAVRFLWPKWFRSEEIIGIPQLLLWTLLAVICVFSVGILVEWIRTLVLKGIHKGLLHGKMYRKMMEKIETADGWFSGK